MGEPCFQYACEVLLQLTASNRFPECLQSEMFISGFCASCRTCLFSKWHTLYLFEVLFCHLSQCIVYGKVCRRAPSIVQIVFEAFSEYVCVCLPGHLFFPMPRPMQSPNAGARTKLKQRPTPLRRRRCPRLPLCLLSRCRQSANRSSGPWHLCPSPETNFRVSCNASCERGLWKWFTSGTTNHERWRPCLAWAQLEDRFATICVFWESCVWNPDLFRMRAYT